MRIKAEEIVDMIKEEIERQVNRRGYACESGNEILEEKCQYANIVLNDILNGIRLYEENDIWDVILSGDDGVRF